jgi:hypothetical protein
VGYDKRANYKAQMTGALLEMHLCIQCREPIAEVNPRTGKVTIQKDPSATWQTTPAISGPCVRDVTPKRARDQLSSS